MIKSYDLGVFLLLLSPVIAKIMTSETAGKILFYYFLMRVAYYAISKK